MDLSGLITKFSAHKNKVVNAIVVVAAVFFAFKIYGAHLKDFGLLKEKNEMVFKNIDVLKSIDGTEKKLVVYRDFLNKKTPAGLINIVTNLAKEAGVEIASIKPMAESSSSFYLKFPLSVIVRSSSYHKIGVFVGKLENNPAVFAVDSARVVPLQDGGIEVSMVIATVLAK